MYFLFKNIFLKKLYFNINILKQFKNIKIN